MLGVGAAKDTEPHSLSVWPMVEDPFMCDPPSWSCGRQSLRDFLMRCAAGLLQRDHPQHDDGKCAMGQWFRFSLVGKGVADEKQQGAEGGISIHHLPRGAGTDEKERKTVEKPIREAQRSRQIQHKNDGAAPGRDAGLQEPGLIRFVAGYLMPLVVAVGV